MLTTNRDTGCSFLLSANRATWSGDLSILGSANRRVDEGGGSQACGPLAQSVILKC